MVFDEATTTQKFLISNHHMDHSEEISKIFSGHYEASNSPTPQTDFIPLFNPVPVQIPSPQQELRRSKRIRRQPEIYGKEYGLFSEAQLFVQENTLAQCY